MPSAPSEAWNRSGPSYATRAYLGASPGALSFCWPRPWERPYDPWVAYHHLGSGELFSEYLIGLIVLVLSLEGALEFTTISFRGKSRRLPSALILFGTLGIFFVVLTATTLTKDFLGKADTGLERRQERLLWGPQRIGDDNTPAEVIGIYQIHPDYFVAT